jgi:hypothetical protein
VALQDGQAAISEGLPGCAARLPGGMAARQAAIILLACAVLYFDCGCWSLAGILRAWHAVAAVLQTSMSMLAAFSQ